MDLPARAFPFYLDAVDAPEADGLYLEFFADDDTLARDEARLAGRLAVFLAHNFPAIVGSLPEHAARYIRERIDPDYPGEPLSFHLRRSYFRCWIETKEAPSDDRHRWLPFTGGFALDGLRLTEALPRDLAVALADELRSAGAIPFWTLNFCHLNEEFLGDDDPLAVRAGVLTHLVRLQRDAALGEEYAPTVRFYAEWSRGNPRGLLALLARVDEELPDTLAIPRPATAGFVFIPPVDSDHEVHFRDLLGSPLWPKGWTTENLVGALRRHAVLRDSLVTLLNHEGFALLEPLDVDDRVEILSLSPAILSAGFLSPKCGMPEWLRGQATLVSVADQIGEGGPALLLRAQAYAALDIPEVLPALDRDLAALADRADGFRGRTGALGAIVDNVRCRGALEWLASVRGHHAWCDVLSASARIRAALWVNPDAFRKLAPGRGYLFVHAIAVAARRSEVGVALARRILADWPELPTLALAGDGKPDVDTLHLLSLSGSPAAIAEAVRIFPALQAAYGGDRATWLKGGGVTGFEAKESAETSQRIRILTEPLHEMPWVPDAFLAGIAPDLGPAFASVFSSARLDGPPDQSAQRVRLATFHLSDDGKRTIATLVKLAQKPDRVDLLPGLLGVGFTRGVFDEHRAIARLIASGDPRAVSALIRRAVPVEDLGRAALSGDQLDQLAHQLREILRRFETPVLPEVPVTSLVDVDLGELAQPLLDDFTRRWPEDDGALAYVLGGCRARAERRFLDALKKDGLDPALVSAVPAGAAFGREALRTRLARAWPDLDATVRDRILDRSGDELLPQLGRASLHALAIGARPWAGGTSAPAQAVTALADGPWKREPAAVARALRDVINELGKELRGPGQAVWVRGMLFALGKLREPVGGRIPNLLHDYANDPAVPEGVRAAAQTQGPLFDADKMKIQHRYSPEQRVQQALVSLGEAGRRVDGPRPVETVLRPARR